MNPDDPRHGTLAGYCAGCRETCCRTAKASDQKRRRLYAHRGIALKVSPLGAQRRIQALMFLGWTTTEIAERVGWTHRNSVRHILYGQSGRPAQWIERRTHNTIAAVYDDLCMTIPPIDKPRDKNVRARARNLAKRNGWAPPLAWDDIDNPKERPKVGAKSFYVDQKQADHAVVARFLAGETNITTTRAERVLIVEQYRQQGRPVKRLEELGWVISRYEREVAA